MKNNRETVQKHRFHNSISHKLIMRISLVFCAVFLLLFVTILVINYKIIIEKETQMFRSYETNTLAAIDDKLKDMCRVSLMSMADEKTLNIIEEYHTMNQYDQIRSEYYLDDFYRSLITIRNDISGVYLLDLESLIFHCDPCDAAVKSFETGEIQEQIASFSMESMKIANCNFMIHHQPFFMRLSGEYLTNPYLKNCIWMVRDIFTFSPHQKAGTIILTAPVKTLRSLCTETLGEDMDYLLLTENGKIVCGEDASGILQDVEEYNENLSSDFGEGTKIVSWNDRWYLISGQRSPVSGLVLLSGKPVSRIAAEIFRFFKYFLLLTGAALAAAILIIICCVREIIRPITYLADEMHKFDSEKLDVRYPVVSNDETGRLIDAFNGMMDMIRDLIEKEYKSQVQIRESKLNEQRLMMLYLKSQINPHFLYNTLDTIRISAELNGDEDVAEMLMQLVSFFRLSVKNNDSVVTLEHEVDLICAYLTLMQYRYPCLIWHISVDEELLETEIPNFVLQPVVENSLLHGLRNKAYEGTISIFIERCPDREECIEIRIEDDGIGFTEETRKKVNRLLDLSKTEGLSSEERESIGIRNVQSRLKAFYPDLEGLSYRNRPEGGICAQMYIRWKMTPDSPDGE